MKYAIRRRILRADPLPKGKESTAATKTTNAVDKRSLLNPEQAAAILDWIRRRPRGGKRLHAFFATLYYCGSRPEEAVAMRVEDVTLPEPDADDQWCELLIHTATPEVGKQWTDTGEIHEQRDLKGRAEGETRTVPGHPALTPLLRQHIEDEQLQPGDLLWAARVRQPEHTADEVAQRRDPARPGGGVGREQCRRAFGYLCTLHRRAVAGSETASRSRG